ncbi:GNAT family N-acetyltransferase [Salinarimonas soli]|uniref:N-acetyltransferase domain-containing protein n=1 Tax=Salinarimonas soli TaxID=1638099 RepID=A0A5B2VX31_9HYPH|nr:GNAT family N-acetyltransferase [Salinarimonas soli]KAA2244393.1 hypothetical protein F0L46_00400 [Salinarimonas soli]
MAPSLRPIDDADLPAVGVFLNRHLNAGASPERYADAFRYRWPARRPNHGFLLEENGAIVGMLGAIYSKREIRGEEHDICNLSCWCVLPDHRKQSLALLLTLVKQPGYTFVNLTPALQVLEIGKAFGFQIFEGGRYMLLNRPRFAAAPGIRVLTPETVDPARLDGAQAGHLANLRGLEHAQMTFVEASGAVSMIVHRRFGHIVAHRLPRVPAIEILHMDLRSPFEAIWPSLADHLLRTQRRPVTVLDQRLLASRPAGALTLRGGRKMFLSKTLGLADIDSLYTELMVGLG